MWHSEFACFITILISHLSLLMWDAEIDCIYMMFALDMVASQHRCGCPVLCRHWKITSLKEMGNGIVFRPAGSWQMGSEFYC